MVEHLKAVQGSVSEPEEPELTFEKDRAYPTANKTAESVAEVLIEHIIPRHSCLCINVQTEELNLLMWSLSCHLTKLKFVLSIQVCIAHKEILRLNADIVI